MCSDLGTSMTVKRTNQWEQSTDAKPPRKLARDVVSMCKRLPGLQHRPTRLNKHVTPVREIRDQQGEPTR